MHHLGKSKISSLITNIVLYETKLYLSFSQTINEEKDGDGGQHRDLPRFVDIFFLFSFLLDVIINFGSCKY